MSVQRVADEYFSQLNPIAARMYVDMRETKLAYEDLWSTISQEEQKQILSESIIKPEISIKYKNSQVKDVAEYSVKFIIDDNCSYRDEHSGPFSFKTQSQRDLSLFEKESQKRKVEKKTAQPKNMLKQKPTKLSDICVKDEISTFKPNVRSHDDAGNTLPKTGLDFLDNW